MSDLFEQPGSNNGTSPGTEYTAEHIEVLEGLEPVRLRPGMYIGGTDERALHHLVAEILDNAMDEAVAGHANRIELEMGADGSVTIRDNGRGIPIDKHPKYPDKSALEVILTTLHSGGKFSGKAYETSGGLHGVGISVVNALSSAMTVEVARDRQLYRQTYSRGLVTSPLENVGPVNNRRGTTATFLPDHEIFGENAKLKPARLYRMARSKAYIFEGVEIRWKCDPLLLKEGDETPASDTLHFANGIADFLSQEIAGRPTATPTPFVGKAEFPDNQGRVQWAVAWTMDREDRFNNSYCNTIPTPDGGTHDNGLRAALVKGLKAYGDLAGIKKASQIVAEDVVGGACSVLSAFIRNPQFHGQTKEKLATAEATRLVENAIRDHFEHWLTQSPDTANALMTFIIDRMEERLRRKAAKEVNRKTATRRVRLPGKLADCASNDREGSEIFLVEGDSAGGSAKQARNRAKQAVLPLRGKILNVASATMDKMKKNQELMDLLQALGVGIRDKFNSQELRYEKVIIMTDADVDGAHIASLLITFFYQEMPELIREGHLYLAQPPLYRISQGGKTLYARDDAHKDELMATEFKGRGKIDISRFKGLGEMPPRQLKETTMNPDNRTLIQITIPSEEAGVTAVLVDDLMGKKPEKRFAFIQENAKFVEDLDV